MAKPRKTIVRHADGTVSTRGSERRVYTHAVEVGPAPAEKRATALERKATEEEAHAKSLREAAAAAKVRRSSRGFGSKESDLSGYNYGLIGTEAKAPGGHTYFNISTYGNAFGQTEAHRETIAERGLTVIEGVAPKLDPERWAVVDARPYLVAQAIEQAERYEESAAQHRTKAAEIRAKGEPVGGYHVPRWTSRRDLGEKYIAGEGSYYVEAGFAVRVVEVEQA